MDTDTPLLWALDFNVDPMCSVVAQMDGRRVRVLDEIVLRRATHEQACEEFERRFPRHAAGLVIYADATGARMQTTGMRTTDAQAVFSLRRVQRREVPRAVSNPPGARAGAA